ncbi:MAG: phage tail sheath subtilisin-like domain-containing protein [Actinomycetota bacterium]|nr:phage tail sheath subtilisin-like domain-containing protein [Actinomycetota bacterium]
MPFPRSPRGYPAKPFVTAPAPIAVACTSTISGVSTSVTAFVGRARRGPVDHPVTVASPAGFDEVFGGPWPESGLGPAVHDFFRQGGSVAIVVRAHAPQEGDTATLSFGEVGDDRLVLRAASPGTWGSRLVARLHEDGGLTVADTATGYTEAFPNLSLVVVDVRPERLPPAQAATVTPATNDGGALDADAYRRALAPLGRADVNLLVLPGAVEPDVVAEAIAFAQARPAVCVLDPPGAWSTVEDALAGASSPAFLRSPNAVVYFPRIREPGPVRAASGAVAGVIARTDLTRGVWKSPAGIEADLTGVVELDLALTEVDAARLNPLGVNCLRPFPGSGPVVWGARTTSPDWKYLPVLRTALFLRESIERGTRWARFEPNDERLWARLRADVVEFMDDLHRRGAFAGSTPRDAYTVRCDAGTTTQDDIDRGVVNVTVGFAPMRPAEFVRIQLQQLAGQALAGE